MRNVAFVVVLTVLGSIGFIESTAHAAPGQTRDPVAVCGKPNGCGPKGIPIVPDRPFAVSFESSCNVHDNCYAMLGKTRTQCDDEFRQDMYNACRRQAHNAACFSLADTYYGVVAGLGKIPYDSAQECANKVKLDNEIADADALVASGPTEASAQGQKALEPIVTAANREMVSMEMNVESASAHYARIRALLEQVNPTPTTNSSTSCMVKNAMGVMVKDPKCIDPYAGPKTAIDGTRADQIKRMKELEAQARSLTERIDKAFDRGRALHDQIRTAATKTSKASVATRGNRIRTLASEGKALARTAASRQAGFAKIGSARSEFFGLFADITKEIQAQTSSSQATLVDARWSVFQYNLELEGLKSDAEKCAVDCKTPPPPVLAPIKPLVLPGQKKN